MKKNTNFGQLWYTTPKYNKVSFAINFAMIIENRIPIYKQIVEYYETAIIEGTMAPDTPLPSMSALAAELGISKETVKKSYGILCRRGLLEAKQGKGFFVACTAGFSSKRRVLMLIDTLSYYRKAFISSFSEEMGKNVDITILIHNQSLELLEYYLDRVLGKYDYYIITPHFPRDEKSQAEMRRQLSRIPKWKLLLADRLPDGMHGNFGAVYQDYENDIISALAQCVPSLKFFPCLDVFRISNSLYGDIIERAIQTFCREHRINVKLHVDLKESDIHAGQICILLNSQGDEVFYKLGEIVKKKQLRIGDNLKILSYNETPICKLLFDGLSTVSADFPMMGIRCARMIKDGQMRKEKCEFRLIRRRTF